MSNPVKKGSPEKRVSRKRGSRGSPEEKKEKKSKTKLEVVDFHPSLPSNFGALRLAITEAMINKAIKQIKSAKAGEIKNFLKDRPYLKKDVGLEEFMRKDDPLASIAVLEWLAPITRRYLTLEGEAKKTAALGKDITLAIGNPSEWTALVATQEKEVWDTVLAIGKRVLLSLYAFEIEELKEKEEKEEAKQTEEERKEKLRRRRLISRAWKLSQEHQTSNIFPAVVVGQSLTDITLQLEQSPTLVELSEDERRLIFLWDSGKRAWNIAESDATIKCPLITGTICSGSHIIFPNDPTIPHLQKFVLGEPLTVIETKDDFNQLVDVHRGWVMGLQDKLTGNIFSSMTFSIYIPFVGILIFTQELLGVDSDGTPLYATEIVPWWRAKKKERLFWVSLCFFAEDRVRFYSRLLQQVSQLALMPSGLVPIIASYRQTYSYDKVDVSKRR